MKSPEIPYNDKERLEALNSYAILDTLPEKEYDEITYLASLICDTPISLISLIDKDRQWFKSNLGLKTTETPREFAFCAHAIIQKDKPFVVKDAREDDRFKGNPLVTSDPNLVFYAGVPLVNTNGHPLGTLCVLDIKPKVLTAKQEKALKVLSNQLMNLLELRKSTILLHDNNKILKRKNKALDKFVTVAAHDIKSPVNNILSLSAMLLEDYSETIPPEAIELIEYIQTSAQHSTQLIDGILSYSKEANGIDIDKEMVNINNLLLTIKGLLIKDGLMEMTLDVDDNIEIFTNRTALHQIFSNLISNSIKYNDKEVLKIYIEVKEIDLFLKFSFKDNGPGIKTEYKKSIFKLFSTTSNKDKSGFHGTGIGLATVKSLVENLGGTISEISHEGEGAHFEFTIQKVETQVLA